MLEIIDAGRVSSIAALLTEFCWCADNGQGDQIAALFTEDAFIHTPHFQIRGRAEILSSFTERKPKLSRHNWMNLRVRHLGGDRYAVDSNMITVTGPLPPPQAGGDIALTSSADEIVFADGAPLFASRTLTMLFDGRIVAKGAVA